MKTKALQQANARLDRAREAFREMERATRFSTLEEAWSNFLVASKLALAKLGAGARGDPTSESWFSRKIGEQRGDPLLSYLHQARNAEEHGLNPSLEHAYDIRVIPGVGLEVEAVFESNGDITFHKKDDPSTIVHFALKGTLQEIVDARSGVAFAPPVEHMGRALQNNSAYGIAETAIRWLEGLVAEARRLPQRT